MHKIEPNYGLTPTMNGWWTRSNDWTREQIVAGMTSAKDKDEFEFGGLTEFGQLGVSSYRKIKEKGLLNQ